MAEQVTDLYVVEAIKDNMKLKWKAPKNKLEEVEVLTVVEDRGQRVLVTSNYTESDMTIIPTYCYNKKDLITRS